MTKRWRRRKRPSRSSWEAPASAPFSTSTSIRHSPSPRSSMERAPTSGRSTFRRSRSTEHIDIISVVRASQAISTEVVLDKLVERLLSVVLAQSGAERGCLLLPHHGLLFVEAEAVARGLDTQVRTFRDAPVSTSVLVPKA